MKFILVLTTASNKKEARILARLAIKKKLAACVTISSSVESHYSWKGQYAKGREVMLFIKTRKNLFEKLSKLLKANHSYSVPEILSVAIDRGNPSYLDWLQSVTKI